MKKEYLLLVIIGLFLLSYLLDALANPLNIPLVTPYDYLKPQILFTYAFTTTSIFIRALAILLIPLLLLSFADWHPHAKAVSLFVIIVLMQLYSLQDIATGANVIPVEWSLSLTIAGLLLIPFVPIYLLRGLIRSLTKTQPPSPPTDNQPPQPPL